MSAPRAHAAAYRAIEFERALIDPAAAFGSPEALVRDARWSRREKIEMLCRWAYDSAELSVAEEEGMGGGESLDMSTVLQALDQITEVDVQRCAPTKQAAFCVASPEWRGVRTPNHDASSAERPLRKTEPRGVGSPGRDSP